MDFQGFTPAQQEKVNTLLASDRRSISRSWRRPSKKCRPESA